MSSNLNELVAARLGLKVLNVLADGAVKATRPEQNADQAERLDFIYGRAGLELIVSAKIALNPHIDGKYRASTTTGRYIAEFSTDPIIAGLTLWLKMQVKPG